MEAQDMIEQAAFNELRDQVGTDFLIELIDTYCLETQELIEKLRLALAAQDAATFGRLAHSIKSSSASLGALNLSQQARELEMLGKANDLEAARPKLEQLAAAFLQVVSCLRAEK
jgi:HPt (histidine-containing phosphotransfer) domain-containing protein